MFNIFKMVYKSLYLLIFNLDLIDYNSKIIFKVHFKILLFLKHSGQK